MIAEKDTTTQVAQKLTNYATATYSRNVGINWGTAEIIERKRARRTNYRINTPIQQSFNGNVRKIPRRGNRHNLTSGKEIKARLRKERQSRKLNRGTFYQRDVKNKTELLLRNARVRSELTYGIQTLDAKEQGKQRLGGTTFYCLRPIQDIYWPNKPQKRQCANLHIATRHPTTKSRIQKLRLKHALTQIRENGISTSKMHPVH